MSFPKDFLLGAVTAAHQVEGNNVNSDSWVLEHLPHTTFFEPSNDAVDHYNRYAEDIRLLADAGLNTYRFSIEWARIEPEEGKIDKKEIEHYRQVIHCCKDNGVKPFVCLHHFTSPKWIITKGGWEAESIVEDFARYCDAVIEQLGEELEYVITINEANMRLQFADVMAKYHKQMMAAASHPDSKSGNGLQVGVNLSDLMKIQQQLEQESVAAFSLPDGGKVYDFHSAATPKGDELIMRAHEAARDRIKSRFPHIKVGLSLSLHDFQAIEGGGEELVRRWDMEFRHYLPYIRSDDFIGVQNYTRELVGPQGALAVPDGADVTQMGHEFYPEGLAHMIRRVAADYSDEILVTEHGVATADDAQRVEFIRRGLDGVKQCIAEGIPVKGYLHWTLLDNFEWQKAYSVQFGLIAVDRATQARTPKPSLAFLGSYRG